MLDILIRGNQVVTPHGVVPPAVIEQIPEMIQAGFPSVKMYTTDVRPQRSNWKMDFGDIWEVLQVLARHGAVVENRQFHGDVKDGRRIERKIADSILSGPACQPD